MKRYSIYFTLILSLFLLGSAYGQTEERVNNSKDRGLNEDFEIYPNPATDYLTIVIKDPELRKAELQLYDIIGNRITAETEEVAKNKYRIEVRELPMGYYILIINDPLSRFKTAYKFSKK